MKRIIVEILLVAALGAAGVFGWTNWKGGQSAASQIAELKEQAGTAQKKLEAASLELKGATSEIEPLKLKVQELDAVKAAMSGGEVLRDIENLYKKEKTLSTEKQLGLGALRMLTRGSKDPGAIEAFKRALEQSDWGSRQKTICAAQNALAAAGERVTVLSECAVGGKPAEAADKSDVPGAGNEAAPGKDGKKPGEKHASLWGYEGAMGPEHWGKEFPTCAKGRSQSPLDIKGPFEKASFGLTPAYQAGQLKIVNNGHTLQVNVPPGSKLRIDSMPFELLQFHFHRPSEELVDGKPAAMVVHFVHRNAAGRLAVLGVLLKDGNENPGIKALWEHAPRQEGPEVAPEGVSFNPSNLLPREYEFYSYEGSLTTPPCTEGVRFFILKSQVNVSREQIEQFPFKRNARPVQPQNGRAIAG